MKSGRFSFGTLRLRTHRENSSKTYVLQQIADLGTRKCGSGGEEQTCND